MIKDMVRTLRHFGVVLVQLNAVSELDWTLADVLMPFDIATLGDAVFRAGTKYLDSSVARTTYTRL